MRVNSVRGNGRRPEQSDLMHGDADSIAAISKNVPLGRPGRPADIGWATAFKVWAASCDQRGVARGARWRGAAVPTYTTTADIKQ